MTGALLGGFIGVKRGLKFDAHHQIKIEGIGSNFGNVRIVQKVNNSKNQASFGKNPTTDYKKTFFEAHPETEGKVIVHHAV